MVTLGGDLLQSQWLPARLEYDAFDDRYLTFPLDEVVPLVTSRYAVTDDPERWGVCGGSSGGDAAFTAAWMRPDRFRRLAENLRVAAALAEAGYDFRLVLGDGGHSPNHGGVLLPDALPWALGPA